MTLTVRDNLLLTELLAGVGVEKAAAAAGMSERTAWRRMVDPEFKAALETARQQHLSTAIDLLSRSATAAASTLVKLLKDSVPATVRLGAARSILEIGLKLRAEQEFEARLAALEAAAGGQR